MRASLRRCSVPYLHSVLLLAPVLAQESGGPGAAARSQAGRDLESGIRRAAGERAAAGWQVGVVVLDERGEPLASLDGERPLSPASNQKILVAGAALDLLGPGFKYETVLAARGPPRDGQVGDLVAKGDGDPNISARFHGGDPTAVFRLWAAELKGAGVKRIAGDLVVDDSCFDDVRFLPGWKESQAGSWYSAEVGALNLNDNCLEIIVRPTRPGQPARVELKPPTAYVAIENHCKTVQGEKAEPVFHRPPGSNTVAVREGIPLSRKEFAGSVSVHDPGLYFGTVLAEVLRREGIALDGKVARGRIEERAGPSPVVLVRHHSPLDEDLPVINKRSQNLHAEVLLKALGARVEDEGSVAGGARAIAKFLAQSGIAAAGIQVEDGSGLSAGNRVSAATLAAVLGWIQRQPYFSEYRDSLPVAGRDGTLKRRFAGRASAGHVFAKTGYIAGVSALSGYVERGGRHWVFAVLVNGLRQGGNRSRDIASARTLQEEIADLVYRSMGLPGTAPGGSRTR